MDALHRLLAIEEIRCLKARYFRFMDERNWDAMAQVFCRDAIWDGKEAFQYTPLNGTPIGAVGPVTGGREAIMTWIKDALLDQTTVHHGHCHEITIESETEARGVIAMQDFIRGPDRQKILLQAAGHYHERYRFEDGAWRIAETKLTRLFQDLQPNQFYLSGVDKPRAAR